MKHTLYNYVVNSGVRETVNVAVLQIACPTLLHPITPSDPVPSSSTFNHPTCHCPTPPAQPGTEHELFSNLEKKSQSHQFVQGFEGTSQIRCHLLIICVSLFGCHPNRIQFIVMSWAVWKILAAVVGIACLMTEWDGWSRHGLVTQILVT